MSAAKIRLSANEMELVTNAEWILTKNHILQKVTLLLSRLQEDQYQNLHQLTGKLPPEIINSSPKISKGDNYLGLPYLVLDYPKYFDKSGVFAIRTMFWWGNFFSVTLHLADNYKNDFGQKIDASLPFLRENDFYYCISQEQWEHHFEESNYHPLTKMDSSAFQTLLQQQSFIKLAKKIPLEQWDEAENILLAYFQQLIKVLID
jgi:hypothetical protein